MGKLSRLLLLLATLALGVLAERGQTAQPTPARGPCQPCHGDLAQLLPDDHPAEAGNDWLACLVCHRAGDSRPDRHSRFFARLHLTHTLGGDRVDCRRCHAWQAGKSFGLQGLPESWGVPSQEEIALLQDILISWAGSSLLDNRHAQAMVGCAGCHGQALPLFDATVENGTCLECHGPVDILAQRTEPPEFKDRNPHQSHLGEINCTVCHKAHGQSAVYCLECHRQFSMTMPEGAQPTQ